MYKGLLGAAALVVSLVLANNSFAFEIYHGKVIDQQEWTSASQQIEVKDTMQKKSSSHRKSLYSQNNLGKSDDGRVGIFLKNKLSDETGVVGELATMPGSTEVYIENLTSVPHTIKIYSNFCLSEESSCANNSFTVELDPHGIFQLEADHRFTHKFDEAGNYGAYFTITADMDGLTAYFATYDEATISIGN